MTEGIPTSNNTGKFFTTKHPLGYSTVRPSFLQKAFSSLLDLGVIAVVFFLLFRKGHTMFWTYVGPMIVRNVPETVPELTDNYHQSQIIFANCIICMCWRILGCWGIPYPWFDDVFPWLKFSVTTKWFHAKDFAGSLNQFLWHVLYWGAMPVIALGHDMFHPWPAHVMFGKKKVVPDHTALWSFSVLGCVAGYILFTIAHWEFLDMRVHQQKYADGETLDRSYMNRKTDSVIKVYNDGNWWMCRLPTHFWTAIHLFFLALATGYVWFAII